MSSNECSIAPKDRAGNCLCSLCSWVRGLSDSAVELQEEILQHLLWVVSPLTSRELRLSPRVRKLWKVPNGLYLPEDSDEAWEFCEDIQKFQVGILAVHSSIFFGNISILQMPLFQDSGLIKEFQTAFSLLRVQDLSLRCEDALLLRSAIRTWAPSLQYLLILRINLASHGEEDSHYYPWFRETALMKFLEGMIKDFWMSKNSSIKRVYLFFGYDEDLDMGDGLTCVGYRYRIMKLPSGDWRAINIACWSEDPTRNIYGFLYHPFDHLPGILEDDLDFFA
ncbi:hypothetical protein HYPSUDRAFT_58050 [Hypholoma sublateritium FD-334 SS-4]|uniref:Uncharacterized protein n=1 Tax=Hypholoma sublateritium (strain FD-334 SS-4) TaxID=945553 RepID=A0A0D2P8X5_HYPSF|nr:hypothetical protein HYPSUDRAFT_58050 [Hypholoma sublateritium FD-334 SS-4]